MAINYRPGDVGIMDDDGFIKKVDRTKDMIIVSGFKVFSVEVDDKMNKHPAIELCSSVGIPDPDLIVFIGDSLAGNDALFQAKEFKKNVGIDANILTKFDADAKGGAALSISFETKVPIIFVGVGQGYDDLEPFDRDIFIKNILE